MITEFMERKAGFAEALPTFSCILGHSCRPSVYPCLMFWLLVETLDMPFSYHDFFVETYMSTLSLCTNFNAQSNNWLLNDTNLLIITFNLQFHIVSGFCRAVDNG
jgi:hypothetical protein